MISKRQCAQNERALFFSEFISGRLDLCFRKKRIKIFRKVGIVIKSRKSGE